MDIGASVTLDFQQYERRYVLSQISENCIADSVAVFVTAGASYRVALYASSSSTNTDGSTLIYDFGIITNSGVTNAWITVNSVGNPSIPAGTYPSIHVKGDYAFYVTMDWYAGETPLADVILSRRTWLEDSAITTAFSGTAQADDDIDGPARIMGLALAYTPANPSAALTAPIPSGPIGSTTTATIGATTNQGTSGSNNVYAVATTAALTGITAAQVKAGQNASGSTSGVISGSAPVASTSVSITLSGLTAGTTYNYAIVQNNANGDSNVLIGSFTTSVASRSTSITFRDGSNAAVASTSINWFLTSSWGGAVLASGSTSTNSAGALLLTGLSPAAGAYKLFYQLASNENHNGMSPVILV